MLARSTVVTLVPIRNMNRALKFYTKTLGAKVVMRAPGDMRQHWAAIRLGGSDLWLITPSKWEKRTVAYTSFVVKDIRTTVKGLLKKKVKFDPAEDLGEDARTEGPIAFAPWGASAFFRDPEGNYLMLWQNA